MWDRTDGRWIGGGKTKEGLELAARLGRIHFETGA
jgi:hypothetical protein